MNTSTGSAASGRGILLIHPPVAKGCEPPAGIARLAGALRAAGRDCRLWDANLEGQLTLLAAPPAAADTWSRRAARHASEHLQLLRSSAGYRSPDRYARAVSDLNRLLAVAGAAHGVTLGLADSRHHTLSPLRSADLLSAAADPEADAFHPLFSRRLPELLDGIEVVGLSLNYLGQALSTFALLGWLRRHAPRLTLVLGGGLVTSWLRRPGWRNPFGGLVDHLVAGPGEDFLIAQCGGQPARQPALPDFSGLPLADYLAPGLILPYSASAGCYWRRCSFCPECAEVNPYRPLPALRAAGELAALAERHRPTLLHLLDNAVSPALQEALIAAPTGAPWYGFARFEERLADPGYAQALRRSGCVMLKLGLESGDQEVLERLHKGIDLGVVPRVLEALHGAGIATYLYLLFGTPAEDEAAAGRTRDFVARHAARIGFLNVALFNLPLGSADAAGLETLPFYDGDLSLYCDFRHPRGWERGRVRRFIGQEFSREPAIAAILRRDPPHFTSNHAPLFTLEAPKG